MKMSYRAIGLLLLIFGVIPTGCMRATLQMLKPTTASTENGPRGTTESLKLDHVLLKFQQGIQFLESGKLKKARSLFEELRDTHPNISVFHNNLGVTYRRMGLLKQATNSYQRAIEIQSDYPEAHYNLAIALREQGEFRRAEKAYRKAIAFTPDFHDAHYNLAVLYDLYLNEPAKAIRHYQSYLDLGGGNQEEIEIWIAGLQKRNKE